MNTSIWKWRNTAHITKMGIEGTVALASLAAAITTVLIATNIVAVPESLAFISTIVNPIGITALFIAAIYFTILAISSYQQMHKNEEIGEAGTSAANAKVTKEVEELIQSKIEAKTKGLVTEEALETALKAKANKKYVDDQLVEKADASALRTKADKTALEGVQESITNLTNNLGEKLNSSDLKEKVKTVLKNPEVTALLKEAISQEA
ncbi:DUF4795 domain-containing protein [Wolbachia pipientis]|uniref:DUF4795 domain-containing protein n=1 Tax=Wolbachia pipientis TaxID=955 RepID=UPI002030276A|nr:DUF4795 domain-containing protein [Wolbachia pipientis]MCM1002255.1 hypothetical protein [Wolbachia pipientis]